MMWGVHLSLLAMLLNWLQAQGIGAAFYLLAISYPALALTKVRSFLSIAPWTHRRHVLLLMRRAGRGGCCFSI